MFLEQEKLVLSEQCKIADDVFVSSFEGLSLAQYRDAQLTICKTKHSQPCSNCSGMVSVANEILSCGFMKLTLAYKRCSPNNSSYKASAARGKMLRIPLACVGVGDQLKGNFSFYLIEKQNINYTIFQTLLANSVQQKTPNLSKNELKGLLYLAESESEKERLKFVAVKAGRLSGRKASAIYGVSKLGTRQKKIEDALEHSSAIRESIEKIAKIKDRALLASYGFEAHVVLTANLLTQVKLIQMKIQLKNIQINKAPNRPALQIPMLNPKKITGLNYFLFYYLVRTTGSNFLKYYNQEIQI